MDSHHAVHGARDASSSAPIEVSSYGGGRPQIGRYCYHALGPRVCWDASKCFASLLTNHSHYGGVWDIIRNDLIQSLTRETNPANRDTVQCSFMRYGTTDDRSKPLT